MGERTGDAMGRKVDRLSPRAVETKPPGYWLDGAGLHLAVSRSKIPGAPHSRSWIFAYTLAGRSREMGLGSTNALGLAEARAKARECRALLLEGVDPIEARDARRAQAALEAARSISFSECARRYIAAHKAGWLNKKHGQQWENTLRDYAEPILGKLPVADINTALVLRVLEPIWTKKAETAKRVRARIEAILDWAAVRGFRTGDNPARWAGHLKEALPSREDVAPVEHHAALPYDEIGEFIAALRKQEGVAARALEFTILTWSRTAETIGARPEEFDLDRALWVVPAARMKGKKGKRREHRVALSPRAVEIARSQMRLGGPYLFPGGRKGRPLSNMAMAELLKRMGRGDLTVHGFRSTARDWAAEQAAFPNEMCELALAHKISDAAEAAYRRGDQFQKRVRLMSDWQKWCDTPAKGKVTPIRGGKRA